MVLYCLTVTSCFVDSFVNYIMGGNDTFVRDVDRLAVIWLGDWHGFGWKTKGWRWSAGT